MKHKYVILGAGITGLSMANFLQEEDYCIIEKEKEAGGYCRTIHRGEFVWDYAGHFFHFQNEENKKFFEQAFSPEHTVVKKKNTRILYQGQYIDYPFQCNIHQLPQKEFIDCLSDLYFAEERHSAFSNFQTMLYAKFGESIAEKFLIPYNEKLYACDLNLLDADAMGRFFPYASIKDVLVNAKKKSFRTYNDSFVYPQEGAERIIHFLLNKIDTTRIKLNTNIKAINTKEKKIITEIEQIEYEYLISTIPLPEFLKLSGEFVGINEFTYNKVLVFNLGFDKPNESIPYHWIYVPDKKNSFYRVGFYNNIIGSDRLSLYVEIGFDRNAVIDVEKEMRDALKSLEDLKIITDHRLIANHTVIMDPAYVHISAKSEELKRELFSKFERNKIYFAGRYGEWTYCSMEDCVNQAKNLAKELHI